MTLLMPFRSIALLVSLAPAVASAGGNWPEFRGANGVGVAAGADLPAEFGEGKHVTWKTPIHGKGWSSPVVWGKQVWLTTATEDGKRMSVLCVDADDGKVLHDRLLFENAEPTFAHATNSYASPTPAIEAGRVYVHFGHYGTACLDTATAKTLWVRRDIACDEFRGPGSSPVLVGDLLIFNCDGFDAQFVIALDKRTGETVWKTARDIDYGTDNGDYKKAYATPSVVTVEGRPQLVSPAAIATIAYDPQTGKELWRVRQGYMNAAARPLSAGGLVLIAAGKDDTSLIAVRPEGAGEQTANIVWKSNKGVSQRPSPLVVGDHLYMMSDGGVASCRDAATGEIRWMERVGGEYWASPVSDGKKIFCFSKDGRAPVIAASPQYALLSENKFDEGFHATPAIAGHAMFVRGRNHLYKIE